MSNGLERVTQLLIDMGLTKNQAIIYTYLTYHSKEKANQIAKQTGIDRSYTYLAVSYLEEKGLINKTLGSPNYYEAIPLREAFKILLGEKKEEYEKLSYKAKQINQDVVFKKPAIVTSAHVKFEASNRDKIIKEINRIRSSATESLDVILNKKRIYQDYPENIMCCLKIARRGVRLRIIIEGDPIPLQKKIQILNDQPSVHIKIINGQPVPILVIVDKKYTRIGLVPGVEVNEEKYICSSNTVLIKMAQTFFDKIWNQAQDLSFINKESLIH